MHLLDCPCTESTAALSSQGRNFLLRISLMLFLLALGIAFPGLALAQSTPGPSSSNPDAQQCATLTNFGLESAPGGPAVITSARLVDVPSSGLERCILTPSGY